MKLAIGAVASILILAAGGAGASSGFPPEAEYSDSSPIVSPDGKRIAFLRTGIVRGDLVRADSLYVADANGRHARALTRGSTYSRTNTEVGHYDAVRSVSWSPDGRRLVYEHVYQGTRYDYSHGELVIVDADGKNAHVLVASSTPYEQAESPSWSAVRNQIVFDESGGLYRIDPDGSDMIAIAHDPDPKYDPAWSPDGSKIAVAIGGGLALITADGSRGPFLGLGKIGAGSPSWSPDGKTIAFNADPDDINTDIYTVEPDGSHLRRLTANPAPDINPSWTPDGKAIVFASARGRGYLQYDLWTMDADGRHERPLARRPVRHAWNGRRCTITGTVAADELHGTPQADVLCGRAGNDFIYARDHRRDVVDGGSGRDRAQIDKGLDVVRGVEKIIP